MPVEPVTPPDSAAWRVVHFPVILVGIAIGLFILAGFVIKLLGFGFQVFPYVPGARYIVPLIGAATAITVYWVFVRIVERRSDVAEFGTRGWLTELSFGFCGGLALSVLTFLILNLIGGLRVVGFNPPYVMLLPLVVQFCTAIVLELIFRGLFFRLIERLLGSWLALLLSVICFGAAALFGDDDVTPSALLGVVLSAALISAALYMLTRRLWAAIGLHAAWSFTQIALYGVPQTSSGPHGLVLSQAIGPDWMTGGRAGPNASIPALIVEALFVAALLMLAVRRGHIVRPTWQRGRAVA